MMSLSRKLQLAVITVVLSSVLAYSQNGSQTFRAPSRLGVSNMQLIHCTPGVDSPGWNVPCFRFTVNVLDDQGDSSAVPAGFSTTLVQIRPDAKEWKVLPRDPKGALNAQRKRYVLILFDVSGSMNDLTTGNVTKFVAAKKATESALTKFTSGADCIAIVPFDSQHVADRIREAVFAENIESARQQLSKLPQPATGNTALYDAVVQGIALLGQKDRDSQKVLMVMTDGMNDVGHPGDDAGLQTGIKPALEAVKNSQMTVFTIGFGQAGAINEKDMVELASASDNFARAANAEALLKKLEDFVTRITNSFRVTTAIKDVQSFETLGQRSLKLRIESGGKLLESDERDYVPPAFNSPSTDLVADEEEARQYILENKPPNGTNPTIWKILTFVFYALVIIVMWFLLPRFIWPAEAESAAGQFAPVEPIRPVAPARPKGPPQSTPRAPRAPAADAQKQNSFGSGTFVQRPGDGTTADARAPLDKTSVIRPQGSRLRTPDRKDQG